MDRTLPTFAFSIHKVEASVENDLYLTPLWIELSLWEFKDKSPLITLSFMVFPLLSTSLSAWISSFSHITNVIYDRLSLCARSLSTPHLIVLTPHLVIVKGDE